MKKIKWAICGLGNISVQFLKVARENEQVEIVACCSSSKERANEYAKTHNIKYAFTYEEMCKNADKVDAIYVCTNMSDHHKNTIAFLRSGINVLCEKAIATTYKEAKEMIDTAKENNVLLMEAMWTKFLPCSKEVTRLAKSGEIGKIKSIDGEFSVDMKKHPQSRVFDKTRGGGSILDLGVYNVSYAYMICGKPDKIFVSGQVKSGVDTECRAILEYNDGIRVTLVSGTLCDKTTAFMKIECERATIKVDNFFGSKSLDILYNNGESKHIDFEDKAGFSYQIAHFNDLLKSNKKESDIVGYTQSLDVMEILNYLNTSLGVEF